jgi:hypothetical protein
MRLRTKLRAVAAAGIGAGRPSGSNGAVGSTALLTVLAALSPKRLHDDPGLSMGGSSSTNTDDLRVEDSLFDRGVQTRDAQALLASLEPANTGVFLANVKGGREDSNTIVMGSGALETPAMGYVFYMPSDFETRKYRSATDSSDILLGSSLTATSGNRDDRGSRESPKSGPDQESAPSEPTETVANAFDSFVDRLADLISAVSWELAPFVIIPAKALTDSGFSLVASIQGQTLQSFGFSGAVIDGYIEGAEVFADVDGDGQWSFIESEGLWEPISVTNARGEFSFSTTLDLSNAIIIAKGGVDVETGASVDILLAPAGVSYVTPISTLVHYAGDDAEVLLASMGLTLGDLTYDPVRLARGEISVAGKTAADAENLLKSGAAILTAVSTATSTLSSLTGGTVQDTARQMFSSLVESSKSGGSGPDFSAFSASSASSSDAISTLLSAAVEASLAASLTDMDEASRLAVAQVVSNSVKEVANNILRSDSLESAFYFARLGQVEVRSEMEAIAKQAAAGGAQDLASRLVADAEAVQSKIPQLFWEAKPEILEQTQGVLGLEKSIVVLDVAAAFAGSNLASVSDSALKNRVVLEIWLPPEMEVDRTNAVSILPASGSPLGNGWSLQDSDPVKGNLWVSTDPGFTLGALKGGLVYELPVVFTHGYSTGQDGISLAMTGQVQTTAGHVRTIETRKGGNTATFPLTVAPQPLPALDETGLLEKITLTETSSADEEQGWSRFEDYFSLPPRPSSESVAGQYDEIISIKSTGELTSLQWKLNGGLLPEASANGRLADLSREDFLALEFRAKAHEKGDLGALNIEHVMKRLWPDGTEIDRSAPKVLATLPVQIKSVPSGIADNARILEARGTEDSDGEGLGGALTVRVQGGAALDPTETLSYQLRAPAWLRLNENPALEVVQRVEAMPGGLSSSGLTPNRTVYTLSAKPGQEASFKEILTLSFAVPTDVSSADLRELDVLQIRTISEEPGAGRVVGAWSAPFAISIDPVSDTPELFTPPLPSGAPSDLAFLLSGMSEVDLPLLALVTDPSETASVRITIRSGGLPVTDGLTLHVGDQLYSPDATGSVVFTATEIANLYQLRMVSDRDFRGGNALDLTVTASSLDRGLEPSAAVSVTKRGAVEIYQPLPDVGLQVDLETVSDRSYEALITLRPSAGAFEREILSSEVTFLITGLASGALRAPLSEGTKSVGLALGGGVWIVPASDLAATFSEGVFTTSVLLNTVDESPASLQVRGIVVDAKSASLKTTASAPLQNFTLDPMSASMLAEEEIFAPMMMRSFSLFEEDLVKADGGVDEASLGSPTAALMSFDLAAFSFEPALVLSGEDSSSQPIQLSYDEDALGQLSVELEYEFNPETYGIPDDPATVATHYLKIVVTNSDGRVEDGVIVRGGIFVPPAEEAQSADIGLGGADTGYWIVLLDPPVDGRLSKSVYFDTAISHFKAALSVQVEGFLSVSNPETGVGEPIPLHEQRIDLTGRPIADAPLLLKPATTRIEIDESHGGLSDESLRRLNEFRSELQSLVKAADPSERVELRLVDGSLKDDDLARGEQALNSDALERSLQGWINGVGDATALLEIPDFVHGQLSFEVQAVSQDGPIGPPERTATSSQKYEITLNIKPVANGLRTDLPLADGSMAVVQTGAGASKSVPTEAGGVITVQLPNPRDGLLIDPQEMLFQQISLKMDPSVNLTDVLREAYYLTVDSSGVEQRIELLQADEENAQVVSWSLAEDVRAIYLVLDPTYNGSVNVSHAYGSMVKDLEVDVLSDLVQVGELDVQISPSPGFLAIGGGAEQRTFNAALLSAVQTSEGAVGPGAQVTRISGREDQPLEFFLRIRSSDPDEQYSIKAVWVDGVEVTAQFDLEDMDSVNGEHLIKATWGQPAAKILSSNMPGQMLSVGDQALRFDLEVQEAGVAQIFENVLTRVSARVTPSASQPTLAESAEPIRVELDASSAANPIELRGNAPLPLPPEWVSQVSVGRDLLNYRFYDVPSKVAVTGATVLSSKNDAVHGRLNQLNLSQSGASPSNMSIVLTAATLALMDSAQAFEFSAVLTDPISGDSKESDRVDVYVAERLAWDGLFIDPLTGVGLMSGQAGVRMKGGMSQDMVDASLTVRNGGIEIHSDEKKNQQIYSEVGASEILFHLDPSDAARWNGGLTYNQPVVVELKGLTLSMGRVDFQFTSDVISLPDVSAWGYGTAAYRPDALFDGGLIPSLFESSVSTGLATFLDLGSLGSNGFGVGFSIDQTGSFNQLTPDGSLQELALVRNLHGGDGDDFLVAHSDADAAVPQMGSILFGGRGFDELRGAHGDDLLIAGYGTDLVFGGSGNDIFQIATDMDAGYYSRMQMEAILGNLLGVDTTASGALVSAIESAHLQITGAELGSDTTYDFAALVTDFNRSTVEADRVVFDASAAGEKVELQWIGKEVWGGQQDFLYAFTRVGPASLDGAAPQDAYTAALIIPEFSPTDVSLLDLERDGILSV